MRATMEQRMEAMRRQLLALREDVQRIKERIEFGDELMLWSNIALDSIDRWNAEHLENGEGRDLVG